MKQTFKEASYTFHYYIQMYTRSHHCGPSNCPSLSPTQALPLSLQLPWLQVAPLKWGDAAALEQLTAMGSFEMLVGSDVTYRPECLGTSAQKGLDKHFGIDIFL